MNDKMFLFFMLMYFKDEKKFVDMVDIFCEIEEILNRVWQKLGVINDGFGNFILDDFSCFFSGDQLICVRVIFVRYLRVGCYIFIDCLVYIELDVFEFWYVKQNLFMVGIL